MTDPTEAEAAAREPVIGYLRYTAGDDAEPWLDAYRDAIIARRDTEVAALDGALRGILDAYRLVEDTSRDVFVRADAERLLRQSISIARALMPFTKEAGQ